MVYEKVNRAFKALQNQIDVNFRAIRRNQEIIELKLVGNIVNIQGKKSLVGSVTNIMAHQNNLLHNTAHHPEITPREKEVLNYICHGYSNTQIGELLNLSSRTVEGHRNRLLKKAGCKNSVCLAVFAVRNSLIQLD